MIPNYLFILAFTILILLGIVIYLAKFKIKHHGYESQIKQEQKRAHDQMQEEILQLRQEVNREIQEFREQQHKNLDLELEAKRARVTGEINVEREKEFSKLKEELLKTQLHNETQVKEQLAQLEKDFLCRKFEVECTLNDLNEKLEDLEDKKDSVINLLKEEERIANEKDTYRILIKKEDKEDIEQLLSIEKRLHNKDILYKLIYKTFIESSMNMMFNRIGAQGFPGIYRIVDLENEKCYIGQSTNVRNRLRDHIKASLGISTIAAQMIHDVMHDKGLDNFAFHIIEECEREKLNEREKYYINYYHSIDYGYNKKSGGQ